MTHRTTRIEPQFGSGPVARPKSDPDVFRIPKPGTPGLSGGDGNADSAPLTLLADNDNQRFLLKKILGRNPNHGEQIRFDQVLAFARSLWGRIESWMCYAHWFLHEWSSERLGPMVLRLQKEGFAVHPSGINDDTAHDTACDQLRASSRYWVEHKVPGDLLVVSACSKVADLLIRAADLRPESRIGILSYKELMPRQLIGTRVDVFDLEYDARAHRREIPRASAGSAGAFDPSTIWSRS